jgi:hypothetical protein
VQSDGVPGHVGRDFGRSFHGQVERPGGPDARPGGDRLKGRAVGEEKGPAFDARAEGAHPRHDGDRDRIDELPQPKAKVAVGAAGVQLQDHRGAFALRPFDGPHHVVGQRRIDYPLHLDHDDGGDGRGRGLGVGR